MSDDAIPGRNICTVCRGEELAHLVTVDTRLYRRCPECGATLLDPEQWLSEAQETAIYRLHENSTDDPGYRRFLARLSDPLLELLAPGDEGLDFGCGPGPALAAMLELQGHTMALFDPAFFPDTAVLRRRYDFITCTEVVEHLQDPLGIFTQLDALLKPGGLLGVMTCFQTDDRRFAEWHYRRDPTHIVFYREATLHWLARHFRWRLVIPRKDVALFCKR